MRRRLVIALCAVPMLFGLLTVATSAEAASYSVYIYNTPIGINNDGKGKVLAKCNSSSTCTGTVHFYGDKTSPGASGYAPIKVPFSIPARAKKYVYVTMNADSPLNPNRPGDGQTGLGDDVQKKTGVKVTVVEKRPRKVAHYYTRTVETKLPGGIQQLRGTVTGSAGSLPVSDVKVRLFEKKRGGSERLAATREVTMVQQGDTTWRGDYNFGISVDTNNQALISYYLKIEGRDSNDQQRSWWWRGYDDDYLGGPRYSKDAASITVQAEEDFNADFSYGFITGKVLRPSEFGVDSEYQSFQKAGVDVSIAAPPPNYYGSDAEAMRELDVDRCANVYARVKTVAGGIYRADFLPTGSSRPNENRYTVGARSGGAEVWVGSEPHLPGNGNDVRFGSCYAATGYSYARGGLLDLEDSLTNVNLPLTTPTHIATIDKKTPAYSRRVANDYWVTIREKIPGASILDSPVVAEGFGASPIAADGKFRIPQGQYWVETGRRTACTAWLPSRFRDNNAYFKGADRGAEKWKTVNGKIEEYAKSIAMGYVRRTPPSGYKGWMYRDYCKTLSAGTINTFTLGTSGVVKSVSTAKKGGVVSGRVTRAGGRTNKEMLVRLSRSDGTTVLRTDLTDSSGRFYVAGLKPGRYTISVNSDSWRGIGRSFIGKHSITVGSGSYSAGTLYFRG